MSLCHSIFSKSIDDLKFSDLEKFFSVEREEDAMLEFKSGGIEINDIYREICAFLNTNGGLLILGSPRESYAGGGNHNNNGKRICIGELIPTKFRNKEWIMQKISSNISPVPQGIKLAEFLKPEGNYFLIEVPKSNYPPHQCVSEGKYYIRLDDESRPAPHGIVEALFYKRQKPNLVIDYNIKNNLQEEVYTENQTLLTINIRNDSDFPAHDINYWIRIGNAIGVKSLLNDQPTREENERSFFTIKDKIYDALIKGINLKIQTEIQHKGEPLLLHILAWSLQASKYELICLYDPINNEIIESNEGTDLPWNLSDAYQDKLKEWVGNLG